MNEHSAALRAPFPVNAIKVKPQTVTADKTKGLVTYYVDARLVAERLNEVVGVESWTDEYKIISGPSEGTPIECRLTVLGVTKADVGQIEPGELDNKSWKSSYSDSFKRAAVKFGVGAYLYESPNVWAEIKVGANGKAQGFSENGRAEALAAYARWVGGEYVAESRPQAAQAVESAQAAQPQQTGDWRWPFGKHKGLTLADTPDEYLDWFEAKGEDAEIRQRIADHRGAQEFVGAAVGGDDLDDVPFRATIDGLGN